MIKGYGAITTYNNSNHNISIPLFSENNTIPKEHSTEGEVDVKAAFEFLKKRS